MKQQQPPPERNGNLEELGGSSEPQAKASAFQNLTKRLLNVTAQELKEAERKWQENRTKR